MPMLKEAIDSFLKVDRSACTNRNYRRVLIALAASIGPDRDITLVTYADLLDYTNRLRQGIQPNSFAAYVLVLKSLFSWAARCGLIPLSPATHLIARTPPRDPSEQRGIPLRHLEEMRRYAYPNPRNYALLLFLASTGARIGGVATLRLSRLDIADGCATLLEKGRRFVEVYFDDETGGALRRWLAVRPTVEHDFVWTRNGQHEPLQVAGLTDVIHAISKAACGVKYGPHRFRHLVAETLEAAGYSPYDIRYKLNHADPRTTEGFYLRNRHPAIKEMSRRISAVTLTSHEAAPPDNIISLDDCG